MSYTITPPSNQYYYTTTTTSPTAITLTTGNSINTQISLPFMADLVNLTEKITRIEERLMLLDHNLDLESRWKKLKDLGDEYRMLEKRLLDMEKMNQLLKG